MYGEHKNIATRKTEGSSSWFSWFSNDLPVEEPVVADEFAPVEPSPLIPQPIKAEYSINLMTVGGYDDAKIKTKITLLYDPSWKIYQTVVQVVGSPFIAPIWKVKHLEMNCYTCLGSCRVLASMDSFQKLRIYGIILGYIFVTFSSSFV